MNGLERIIRLLHARGRASRTTPLSELEDWVDFDLDEAIPILERTPATLSTLLDELPEDWTTVNEGPDTWSPREVVGHLIHGERTDWIPRARIILQQGKYR